MKIRLSLLLFVLLINIVFADYKGWNEKTAKKENYLINNGMTPYQANYTINKCKRESDNPKWCVELITHLWIHEGARGTSERCKKNNNCFWLFAGNKYYNNYEESIEDWIIRFNKYWHNSNCYNMVYLSRYTITQQKERVNNCNITFYNLNNL